MSQGLAGRRRARACLALVSLVALMVAVPAAAQVEVVVVDESLWSFNSPPANPGSGTGLEDWQDFFNSGWRCPRLPIGGVGADCGPDPTPDPPAWDVPERAFIGRIQLQSSPLANRWAGLIAQSEPGDITPPIHEPYEPSVSGEILKVRGTFAIRMEGANGSNSVTAHLLLEQGGSYYVSDASATASISGGGGPTSWVQFGPVALDAANFDLLLPDETLDASSHPDFSATAPTTRFGFVADLSFFGVIPNPPGFLNRFYNIDGLEISVLTPAPATVPALAPAATASVVLGLAAAGLIARGRRRG